MVHKKYFTFDVMVGGYYYLTMKYPMALAKWTWIEGKPQKTVDLNEVKAWAVAQKPSLEHKQFTIEF